MSSTFSPYKYQISQFTDLSSQLIDMDSYYNTFTMLSKKVKRNTYKVSLAQMLHYFSEFGIGYGSVCVTSISTQQEFNTVKYVNRHATKSDHRPATVGDLKNRIVDIIAALVRSVVRDMQKSGIKQNNIIYPRCIFTLDTDKHFSEKLKLLTGQTYEEVDFTDFAYSSDKNYAMPAYQDGYVPANYMLMCPQHTHGVHSEMYKSIYYKWNVSLSPQGNTMWEGYANGSPLKKFSTYNWDSAVNPLCNPSAIVTVPVTVNGSASWQYPEGISCLPNEIVYPENSLDVNGEKKVTIRFPGRRYRLFKRKDN